MNKKLFGSIAAMVVVLALVGSGTLAAFSDFQTIEDNEVAAGTLALNVNFRDGSSTRIFEKTNIIPDQSPQERYVHIASNDSDSTPPGRLFLTLENLDGNENGCDTNSEAVEQGGTHKDDPDAACNDSGLPHDEDGQLIEQAQLRILSWDTATPSTCTAGAGANTETVTGYTTLVDLEGDKLEVRDLAPGDGVCVFAALRLPTRADNDAAQGDEASFDFRFDLEQVDAVGGSLVTP